MKYKRNFIITSVKELKKITKELEKEQKELKKQLGKIPTHEFQISIINKTGEIDDWRFE